MSLSRENPVARHADRLLSRHRALPAVLVLLLGAGLLGLLVQHYGMERDLYSSPSRFALARWLAATLVAEMLIVAPWAAVRGALLWQRLARDGHLEDYRRSRMSAGSIALGMLRGALAPVPALLGLSLAASLTLGVFVGAFPALGAMRAHALLLVLAAAYAALGMRLAARVRHPALAVPLALLLLAASATAIWAVDPFLRRAPNQGLLIYAALLPNPATAVASALETDVLRYSWLYERIHAHEYFFVYPPLWQTALLHAAAAALLVVGISRRIACDTDASGGVVNHADRSRHGGDD